MNFPACILAVSCAVSTAGEPTLGVDIAVVPSVKTVAPSSRFTVGLTIHHHPGFHTYWQNPGAVGYPTKISWELPAGFIAGEIRWAVPEMSSMAGHPVFGYESDVTLLVDIISPAKLPDDKAAFSAKVSWMACADQCRPGNEQFEFDLPVTREIVVDPSVRELFTAAEARIPQPLEHWTATLQCAADAKEIVFLLTPPEGLVDPGTLRVYSSDGQISSDPDPLITRQKDGSYLVRVERAEYAPAGAASLPFVLVGQNALSPEGENFGTLNPAYAAPE